MLNVVELRRTALMACALALMLGGCSSSSIPWPFGSSPASATPAAKGDPAPEIQNCLGYRIANCDVVIDDQDGWHGTTISNVVPAGVSAKRAVPPWAAATSRTTDRPKPVPSARPVTNGSNKWSRMLAGGPAPSS